MDDKAAEQIIEALQTRGDIRAARVRRTGVYERRIEVDLPDGSTALWQVEAASLRALIERNGVAVGYVPTFTCAATASPSVLAALIATANHDTARRATGTSATSPSHQPAAAPLQRRKPGLGERLRSARPARHRLPVLHPGRG